MRIETIERLENIERMMVEAHKLHALYAPLATKLMPIRRAYLLAGRSPEELEIHLPRDKWPRQFEAGIKRCVGIDISWVDFTRTI